MEALIVVYDRRGQVRFRQKIAQLPATIGRSPACDVILDDRLVSGVHARLEDDDTGRLVLRDQGSKNGLRLGRMRVNEVVFPVPRAVVLGNTRISVLRSSDPSEPTELRRWSWLDRRWAVAPALALVVAAEAVSGWLGSDDLKLLKLIAGEVLPMVLGLAVWALGWSIASRIAQGVFRYLTHLTLAALSVGAARWVGTLLLPAAGFLLSLSPTFLRRAGEISALVAGCWLLAQHLSRTGSWRLSRCYGVSALIMLAIGLPVELAQLAKADDFESSLSIPRDALPPPLVMRPSSISDFLSRTERLQKDSDRLRKK